MKPSALLLLSFVLLGCPSKDNASSSGATPPSATTSGSGPLASLESAPFQNEVWISQEGAQMAFLFYPQQNVRISAPCRSGAGQLACDAIRQLRNGMPVAVARRSLSGNVSAGTRVCMTMKHQLVSAHNSVGAEDGFCRFPDGSLVSTGALEQYGMRVVE